MSRPVWLVELIKKSFPGRFLVARATRLPLLGRMMDHLLFEGDDLFYLPRDRSIKVDWSPIAAEEMVLPSQVVEHFIERASYHWIMNTCLCRDSSKCVDYPVDLGCLFLGDAAMGIHPQLGRHVTKEAALAHVRRCREAGLVHLIGRNKLDAVWLGVGPGNKLLTICNCCPCCCLWRVLPYVSDQIGSKVTRMPGVSVTVTDRCIGCGTCTQGVCFVGNAIQLVEGHAVVGEACRGCGRCADVCPQAAIEVSIDDSGWLETSIARIAARVNVA